MRKIFVSSTFADFNEERDWLRNRIQPLLNKEASKYGEYVMFCDLRWGIDTAIMEEETADRKVLQVCMNEIDSAEPYTLILLGERYGSVFNKDIVEKTITTKSADFAKQLSSLEISVTQLEIEYALFRNKKNLKKTFVYIRKIKNDVLPDNYSSENQEKKKKLEALKERLCNLPNVCVRTYEAQLFDNGLNCGNEFVELVYRDLLEKLKQDWKEYDELLPFEKEYAFHWNYIKRKFIAKDRFTFYQCFEEEEKGIVRLEKQLSNREIEFSGVCLAHQRENWTVIPIYGGKTECAESVKGILEYIVSIMKKDIGINQDEQRTLEELFGIYEQNSQELLIAICGIELVVDITAEIQQLISSKKYTHIKYYIMGYFGQCPEVLNYLKQNGFRTQISMVPKIPAIIQKYFDNYGKEIEASAMQRLQEKLSKWNFSFVEIALQMLLAFDSDDFDKMYQLDKKQSTYLLQVIDEELPDKEEKIFPLFISKVAKQLNEMWLVDAVKFLAVSEFGLRQIDIEQLMKSMNKPFTYVSFLQMMNYTEGIFEEQENGYYAFADVKMKECFLMGMSAQEKLAYAERLEDYLVILSQDDTIFQTELRYVKNMVKQIIFCEKIIAATTVSSLSEKARKYAKWILAGGLERARWFEQAVSYYNGYAEEESSVLRLGCFHFYYIALPEKKTAADTTAYELIIRLGFAFVEQTQEIHGVPRLHLLTMMFGAFAGKYYESKKTAGGYQQASFIYYLASVQIEKCKELLIKQPDRLEFYEQFFDNAFKRINEKVSGIPFDVTNLFL